MAKKNFTWKLDEDLVYKIQKLAEQEHRSLTNYIEVMFIEKSQSAAVGWKKNKEKNATDEIAKEIGYENFNDYMRELILNCSDYSVERLNKITNELAKRYATEAEENKNMKSKIEDLQVEIQRCYEALDSRKGLSI